MSAASAREVEQLIQKELDVMMGILDDNMDKLPEGEYLRGMNAIASLYKHKRDTLSRPSPGGGGGVAMMAPWMTLKEIEETDEDLYDEIIGVAEKILLELCGPDTSIHDYEYAIVHCGEESGLFRLLLNYKPQEGNAGYETSPLVFHHAIYIIMNRLFYDMISELEFLRPVRCQCGWRGPQGKFDKHTSNSRHLRWVVAERERKSAKDLEDERRQVVAR